MDKYSGPKRRKHRRHETEVKINFCVNFDIETKINFCVKEKQKEEFSGKKYSAVSRNVSVEGLSFFSPKNLQKGDILLLDVYVPSASTPVSMKGQVRWSYLADKEEKGSGRMYDTGVRVINVEGEDVEQSLFIDRVYNIAWSVVLESILGGFKHLALKRKKERADDGR